MKFPITLIKKDTSQKRYTLEEWNKVKHQFNAIEMTPDCYEGELWFFEV